MSAIIKESIGDTFDIHSTHKIINVNKGDRGKWILEIILYLKDIPTINNSIKCGCVVTVESTKNKDAYTEIFNKYAIIDAKNNIKKVVLA